MSLHSAKVFTKFISGFGGLPLFLVTLDIFSAGPVVARRSSPSFLFKNPRSNDMRLLRAGYI